MNTSNLSNSKAVFTDYEISNEEMLCIRGGEGDIIVKPPIPPVVI